MFRGFTAELRPHYGKRGCHPGVRERDHPVRFESETCWNKSSIRGQKGISLDIIAGPGECHVVWVNEAPAEALRSPPIVVSARNVQPCDSNPQQAVTSPSTSAPVKLIAIFWIFSHGAAPVSE